jgi:hypothetical protein
MTGHEWFGVLFGVAVALLLTWLLLIAALALPTRKMLRLEAAYRRFFPSGDLQDREERLRLQLLVVAVIVILSLFTLLLLSRPPGERAVESTSTPSATLGGLSSAAGPSRPSDPRIRPRPTTTPGASANTGSGSAKEPIRMEDVAPARPFESVRIQGTYPGGADTFLRVQRWEGGKWLTFPLPTKTDQSGRFKTYVEFGQPGRYRLRVLDPDSGLTSKPFVLVIEG